MSAAETERPQTQKRVAAVSEFKKRRKKHGILFPKAKKK
jgi:hypothetical protein